MYREYDKILLFSRDIVLIVCQQQFKIY